MIQRTLGTIMLLALTFSATAQAQNIFWKTKSVNVKFNGSSTQSSYNTIFQKVIVTPVSYECGYNEDPQYDVRPGTCYETTCTGGAGKSAAWDAYFSAKKAEKASKLAAAIKGVGKKAGDSLVAGGYFSSKPRSWNDFKTEIETATARGALTPQQKTMILSTYRNDNMANLGYSSGSCHATPYTCDEVVVTREGGYVPATCVDNVEQLIEEKAVNYTFSVGGAVLLPSETENITVKLSGDPAQASVQSSDYNTYAYQITQANNNSAAMTIQATGRKQVSLPNDGLQSVALIQSGPNQATLQVTVSPSILPAAGTESLQIRYKVRTCQIGFFGTCSPGWDKTEPYFGKITGQVSSFTAPVTLTPGKKGVKMEVEVSVFKQNSIYHDANPITKTTSKITLK